jgi:hypothetical protein
VVHLEYTGEIAQKANLSTLAVALPMFIKPSDNVLIALERLTEPLDEAPADEGGGEMVESLEDVGASLVANGQPAETAEPSQRAFHHPAMASQPLGAVDAAPGNTRLDAASAQRPSAMRKVIALVGMELGRSPLRSADAMADRRHGIDQFFEEAAVVDVCRGEPDGERDALSISNERALGAGSAAIGRIGALELPPNWWTPLLSSDGSGKVSNGPGTASFYG